MKVHILTVGDEILIGQTVDTNSAWMGQKLNFVGAEVKEIVSLSDEKKAILDGISNAMEKADVVLMTGGLGPTKDDITKVAIVEYFGVELKFNDKAFEWMQKVANKLGFPVSENNRMQCYLPDNATILHNHMGTAPGMLFEHEGKVLISMPGVPVEMRWIMDNGVLPYLQNNYEGLAIIHRTLMTAGIGESTLATSLDDFEEQLPENIKLAYLPSVGQVKMRLTARGKEIEVLNTAIELEKKKLVELVAEFIYGEDEQTLSQVIGNWLVERDKTISTAESCTGGYLAHQITSIPGSSAYFQGSVISYSNDLKSNLLGVKKDTLENYGAVSQQTVIEMVQGAVKNMDTDYAIATSGIAGPDGGTPEKPVGTIWLAVGNNEKIVTKKVQRGKNRIKNIEYATVHALYLMWKFLQYED